MKRKPKKSRFRIFALHSDRHSDIQTFRHSDIQTDQGTQPLIESLRQRLKIHEKERRGKRIELMMRQNGQRNETVQQ